jgi:hypothetical protein
VIQGALIENVNKRSEAANRKYRAFIHFLKYQKKGLPNDKNKKTNGGNSPNDVYGMDSRK